MTTGNGRHGTAPYTAARIREALTFDDDDLHANRRGVVSMGQKRRRQRQIPPSNLLIQLLLGLIVMQFALAALGVDNSPLRKLTIAGTLLLVSGLVLLDAGRRWWRFAHRYDSGTVERVCGRVRRDHTKDGGRTRYRVHVEGAAFEVTAEEFNAFATPGIYCLYVHQTDAGSRVLSAELLQTL